MGVFARRLAFSLPVLPLVVAALAHAGCGSSSHDDAPATPDASPEAVAPVVDANPGDTSPPPTNCATDRASDGMWQHLRCTGLYSDFDAKVVASDVRPYKPALALWADGAEKQRWLFLPAGTKIDTSNIDEWVFPNGTKLFKELSLDGKRIETRLYEKGTDGAWRHAAFRWNDTLTDAVRQDGGEQIPRGGPDVPPYQIPTGNECNSCHQGRKDRILGFEAVGLGMAGAEGLTLAALAAAGLLSNPPSSTTVTFPEDTTGKAAAALAWMHVSCGPCHNRSTEATGEKSRNYMLSPASLLLGADGGSGTVDMLDAYTTTVGLATSIDVPDGGGATFFVIKAGDPSLSRVSYLSGRRVGPMGSPTEKEQMPPIVSRLVDVQGHAQLDAWISALPP